MATLLIENGAVLTMDEHDTIHDPGWVWVQDDRIGAVGSSRAPDQHRSGSEALAPPDRVIDAARMAVVPGLSSVLIVNLAEMAGISEPLDFFSAEIDTGRQNVRV